MRYWDTSAFVPIIVHEEATAQARQWLAEDDHVATWVWTHAEITSAIERRHRQGQLTRDSRQAALVKLDALSRKWDEMTDILAVRSLANVLLARHPLRAADAGQLAAALLVQARHPDPLVFLTLDKRLSMAAEREGFRVPLRAG